MPLEPQSRSDYEENWPSLEPGGYSTEESSDILTDDTSSDLSSDMSRKLRITTSGKDKYSRGRNPAHVTHRGHCHSYLPGDDPPHRHVYSKRQHLVPRQISHQSNSVSFKQRIRSPGQTEKNFTMCQSKVGHKTGPITYEDDPLISATTSDDNFGSLETVEASLEGSLTKQEEERFVGN